MKQFTATVLAKWQVVIPKELRDELNIKVWDNLTCFSRGSALLLKKKTKLMPSTDESLFSLWINKDNNIENIAIENMKGITYILWKPGFGKSVQALNMMINMYNSGKSIVVFDPYGDWIAEVKNYMKDVGEEHFYSYVVNWGISRDAFIKQIKKSKQRVITIHGNYQELWTRKCSELTKPIIVDCYKKFVDEDTFVFLDEFSAYYDEEIIDNIIKSSWYSCLLDQGLEYLSKYQARDILKNICHIMIYQVGWITAKYLIENLDLDHTEEELRSIEKYCFYYHSFNKDNNARKFLTSIYPFN